MIFEFLVSKIFHTKAAMQKFATKIVNMMKAEKLYESQGGPIILSQVVLVLHFILFSHVLISNIKPMRL